MKNACPECGKPFPEGSSRCNWCAPAAPMPASRWPSSGRLWQGGLALLVGASVGLLCFVLCCILLAIVALLLLESVGSVVFGLLGFGVLLVIPLVIWLLALAAMFSLAVGGICAAMFRSPKPASERRQATRGGRLLRGLLLACPLLLLIDLLRSDSLVILVLKQFGILLSFASQLYS